ncbi:YfiR/HmsC family protein [Simiduia aestuariiviva]|uniref:DUF4154 domain-containing protein n=1 Tax=Simiduia aestuariiviva TaxID=1510459 RepID=A0A839USK6_9GAMM|nr:YfiR/HmsC family protein [Simiduia aestuariiviva]MBB3168906.1 hypothetical protein [Simiduia aestuariiviva]
MKNACRSMLLGVALLSSLASAKPLPAALNSVLLLKLLAFEASVSQQQAVHILVVNDDALADALTKKIGSPIGAGKLAAVYRNRAPDNTKLHAIYINGEREPASLSTYAQSQHAVTVGNNLKQAHHGVALILYDDEGLPGISISMSPSKSLGLSWDPKVLEVSTLIY